MAVDDMLDDRKPEPRAAPLAAAFYVHAIEPFGEARDRRLRNAFAIVADVNDQHLLCAAPTGKRAAFERDPDMAAVLAILDRVMDQILENLDQLNALPNRRRK